MTTLSNGVVSAPVLTCTEGGKQTNAWHYWHMYEPTSMTSGSIMPSYAWLHERTLDISTTPAKIRVMQNLECLILKDMMLLPMTISSSRQNRSPRNWPRKTAGSDLCRQRDHSIDRLPAATRHRH